MVPNNGLTVCLRARSCNGVAAFRNRVHKRLYARKDAHRTVDSGGLNLPRSKNVFLLLQLRGPVNGGF